jgi:hypothetical protein
MMTGRFLRSLYANSQTAKSERGGRAREKEGQRRGRGERTRDDDRVLVVLSDGVVGWHVDDGRLIVVIGHVPVLVERETLA